MILSSLGKHLVLFGFLLSLWVANVFPVQRAEHVLQATAVVSPQRLIALQSMARGQLSDQSSVRWIRYARSAKAVARSRIESSVEHIHLEIGVRANAGLREVEQELERLTLPSNSIESLSDESKRVRSERWRLAAIDHQLERFRLDRQREGNWLAEATMAKDESITTEQKSNQAVTVSFRKPLLNSGATLGSNPTSNPTSNQAADPSMSEPPANPNGSSAATEDEVNRTADAADRSENSEKAWSAKDQQTWNALLTNRSQCLRCIESLEAQQRATQSQAAGTIALTGAPRYGVVSGQASIANLVSILSLSCFCAWMIGFLLRSPAVQRREVGQAKVALRQFNRKENGRPADERTWQRTDEDPIAVGMAKHKIPYLGTLKMNVSSKATVALSAAESWETPVSEKGGLEAASNSLASTSSSNRTTAGLKLSTAAIEKINSWALWSWVVLFAFRFLTDPNWRELLFSAPLAAFSSMVLGVY